MPLSAVTGLAAVRAVAGVIRLWLRLRYLRYVIDKAAAQGVLIDPVSVIEASNGADGRAPVEGSWSDPQP
jgi:hypothetical protein